MSPTIVMPLPALTLVPTGALSPLNEAVPTTITPQTAGSFPMVLQPAASNDQPATSGSTHMTIKQLDTRERAGKNLEQQLKTK